MGEDRKSLSDDDLEALRVSFGRVGVVVFEGHQFVFQQPNEEHGRFFRRGINAADVNMIDQLAAQLIVAMDGASYPDLKEREPLRMTFRAWLKTRPLAMENNWFSPVFAELLGQAEEGNATRAGKDCLVLSGTPAISQRGRGSGFVAKRPKTERRPVKL